MQLPLVGRKATATSSSPSTLVLHMRVLVKDLALVPILLRSGLQQIVLLLLQALSLTTQDLHDSLCSFGFGRRCNDDPREGILSPLQNDFALVEASLLRKLSQCRPQVRNAARLRSGSDRSQKTIVHRDNAMLRLERFQSFVLWVKGKMRIVLVLVDLRLMSEVLRREQVLVICQRPANEGQGQKDGSWTGMSLFAMLLRHIALSMEALPVRDADELRYSRILQILENPPGFSATQVPLYAPGWEMQLK